MSENSTICVERKDAVTTVIINRPDVRNAIDRPTADALVEAFIAFEHDETAKVAVLWGAGGTFCSGADLKGVATSRGNRLQEPTGAALDGAAPMGPTRLMLSKPVIAAVAGYAVAGGLELACWCDLRVMEEDATLGVFCRRWGVPLIDGGTVRLPRLIGQSRALDMILTGRAVDAAEALSFGLANRIVPSGASRTEAETLAADIARMPQTCMREDRLSVYEQFGSNFPDAIKNEYVHGGRTLASGETVEGASRFASGKGRGGNFDNI
jgi:enoyl-CoA hydratase